MLFSFSVVSFETFWCQNCLCVVVLPVVWAARDFQYWAPHLGANRTSLEDVPGYTSVGLDIRECVWTRPRSRMTICSTDVGLRLRLTSVGKDKGEKAYRGPGYFKYYVKKYRLRLSER